jgi:two-component system, NarL family, nitrate/nitrite response regulator NarL
MVDTMMDTADKLTADKLIRKGYYNGFSSQVGTSTLSESKRPLRIFILSDVRLCREGLALLLAQQRDIEVVGSASSTAAIGDIVALKPHVVFLDAAAIDGCALARSLYGAMPESKLVAFAIREVDEEVIACAEAGIVAYVKRECSSEEMVDILHQAARGDFVCPPKLTTSLFRHIAASSAKQRYVNHNAVMPQQDFGAFMLTRREREIIPFIAQGLTNKEIARSLGLGPATIKNHVHNILEKLGLRRRGEIAAQARLTREADHRRC